MSTYIPGVTDYIPQVQPFQPDYNFLGNILQTRQGKYDAAYNKINGIYASALNSPMMRDENIKKRDDFFKAIDGDIKRISGLDLSKEQNLNQASAVFKPFFDDENIFQDITQTKRFHSGMQKHENLKDCTDPKKCGGSAWDPGAKELQYKAEEFKKMSSADALKFQIPKYTPYYNWEKDAIDLAVKANLSVSADSLHGGWIVKDANGKLVEGGLYNVFKSAYGNDPRVTANYDTKSYVERKDHVSTARPGTEDAVETEYLNQQIKNFNSLFTPIAKETGNAVKNVSARKAQLNKDKATIGLSDEDHEILKNIGNVEGSLSKTASDNDVILNTVNDKNEVKDLATLRRKGDFARAQTLMIGDLHTMAETMSHRGETHGIEVNPYAMEAVHQKNRIELANLGFKHDELKQIMHINGEKELIQFKKAVEDGFIPGANSSKMTVDRTSPWGTAPSTDPNASINRKTAEVNKVVQDSDQLSTDFITQTLAVARRAAKDPSNKGAQIYLDKMLGANSKAETPEEVAKALKEKGGFKTIQEAYDFGVDYLDQSKNPNSNVAWATDFMGKNGRAITEITTKNKSRYAVVSNNIKTANSVVKNIQAQAGPGQEIYKDADLLIQESGIPMTSEEMPNDFLYKYMAKNGITSYDEAFDKAEKTYELLQDKFRVTYNAVNGGNTKSANNITYDNVNTKMGSDEGTARLKSVISAIQSDPRQAYNVISGLPTAENVGGNSDKLKGYSNVIMNKILSTAKDNKNLQLSFTESPIAGNNENLSALTLKLDPDDFKSEIGTPTSPGPLYGIDLTKVSFIYNNKVIKTPTGAGQETPDLVNIINYSGKQYHFPKATVGTPEFVKDKNGYSLNYKLKMFDNGKWNTGDFTSVPCTTDTQVVETDKAFMLLADNIQQANIKAEAEYIASNKNK
jgi:hypothetical protein